LGTVLSSTSAEAKAFAATLASSTMSIIDTTKYTEKESAIAYNLLSTSGAELYDQEKEELSGKSR
jgi:hypothetical protein